MICERNFSTQEVLFLVQAVDSAVTTLNNGSYRLLLFWALDLEYSLQVPVHRFVLLCSVSMDSIIMKSKMNLF